MKTEDLYKKAFNALINSELKRLKNFGGFYGTDSRQHPIGKLVMITSRRTYRFCRKAFPDLDLSDNIYKLTWENWVTGYKFRRDDYPTADFRIFLDQDRKHNYDFNLVPAGYQVDWLNTSQSLNFTLRTAGNIIRKQSLGLSHFLFWSREAVVGFGRLKFAIDNNLDSWGKKSKTFARKLEEKELAWQANLLCAINEKANKNV